MYWTGCGIPQNRVAAYMWYSMAIKNNIGAWRVRFMRCMLGALMNKTELAEAQEAVRKLWISHN
jgi:TPR repeat protein